MVMDCVPGVTVEFIFARERKGGRATSDKRAKMDGLF